MYKVLKLNKIAAEGIDSFPSNKYIVGDDISDPDAIILRSFDMHLLEIPSSLQAVGRAGSGVNNIPVKKLSDLAIPVFNAPGANANAVKELVIAAILICARNIHRAIEFVEESEKPEDFKQRIELGKNKYVGYELPGKTIGVIGLGAIGVKVANACLNLGMNVMGFDPKMTINNAWELQPGIESSDNLSAVLKNADVVTIHIPSTNETRSFIGKEELSMMKDNATLINLSRAEIVDDNAIKSSLTENRIKTYVTDFPDRSLVGLTNVLLLPHLGASTKEAETKCAKMVSKSIRSFLENGNIDNSVNFPEVHLDRISGSRLSVTNQNKPNMVGQFTTCLGEAGININDLSHKSMGEIGYTLIDVDKSITPETLLKISQIEGVISIKNLN
jgi:D-3-phosphoglycerate dehydrogenase